VTSRWLLVLLLVLACNDAPTAPKGPRPSKADTPPPAELISRARKAVDERQWASAHVTLMTLEVIDADGGYSEERLLLQVRTLMAVAPGEAAEEKADELHRLFPESPLGPQVEDALRPLYRLQPGRQEARDRKVKAIIRRALNERRR
jgi:outer membrane protein assembly factor BamD (BamD/ComL family)